MAKGDKPDFVARAAIERDGRDPYWVTLGGAWLAKEGAISVQLNMTPVAWDGHLVLFVPKENDT